MSETVSREILLGESDVAFFSNVKGSFSFDPDLVQMRFYASDRTMLGHIGLSPSEARRAGARLIAGANKIDPQGALIIAEPAR